MNYVPSVNQNNQTTSNETTHTHNRHRTLEGRPITQRIEIHISRISAEGGPCVSNRTNPNTSPTPSHPAPHALTPGRTYIHIVIQKQAPQQNPQAPQTNAPHRQQIVSQSLSNIHAANQHLAKSQMQFKNNAFQFPLGTLAFASGAIKNLFLLLKADFSISFPSCATDSVPEVPIHSALNARQLQPTSPPPEQQTKFKEIQKRMDSFSSQEQTVSLKFTPTPKTAPLQQEPQQKQETKSDYSCNTVNLYQPQQTLPQPILGMTPLFPLKRDEEKKQKKPKKKKEAKKKKKKGNPDKDAS